MNYDGCGRAPRGVHSADAGKAEDETAMDNVIVGIEPHAGAAANAYPNGAGGQWQRLEQMGNHYHSSGSGAGAYPTSAASTPAARGSQQRGRQRHGPLAAVGPEGDNRSEDNKSRSNPVRSPLDLIGDSSCSGLIVAVNACDPRNPIPRARRHDVHHAVPHGGRDDATAQLPGNRMDIKGAASGDGNDVGNDVGNELDIEAGGAEGLGVAQLEQQRLRRATRRGEARADMARAGADETATAAAAAASEDATTARHSGRTIVVMRGDMLDEAAAAADRDRGHCEPATSGGVGGAGAAGGTAEAGEDEIGAEIREDNKRHRDEGMLEPHRAAELHVGKRRRLRGKQSTRNDHAENSVHAELSGGPSRSSTSSLHRCSVYDRDGQPLIAGCGRPPDLGRRHVAGG